MKKKKKLTAQTSWRLIKAEKKQSYCSVLKNFLVMIEAVGLKKKATQKGSGFFFYENLSITKNSGTYLSFHV